MVSNQGWSEEHLQSRTKGIHTVKEADMLSAKMDLLLRKLVEREEIKKQMYHSVQAIDSHSLCEVCRNGGHSGNDCPKTREDDAFINQNNNNGYRPQGGQGWNQSRPPYQGGRSRGNPRLPLKISAW
ncbi:hypothetical protein GQ55_3G323000 [Panicum hallii var. hallii]|uniref:CCHC-type domain-containing protein n=1 Tax=Panicum hallii var. hallii TaxID=1504633 RepID=A0A2T7EFE8_9POAL|nr:hypothetical protein GQ55_3G323000 [Panicum hallii var. hallii]